MRLLKNILLSLLLIGCSDNNISEQKNKNEESSMFGLFGKKEDKNYVIASPLEGTLAKNGSPLKNTKIIRRVYWNGNDEGVTDEFETNDHGYFKLPAFEKTLSLNTMTEFVAKVELFSEKETSEHFFWYSVKRSEHLYSDFDGPLPNLVCDLSAPEVTVEMKEFPAMTRCRWTNMSIK